MRAHSKIALLTASLLTIAACGASSTSSTNGASKRGGILHVARVESFDGWKLDSAAAYASYQTDAAVMEPLLRFAADGTNVEAGLADKWIYDAATHSWTFTLRANATFSSGAPVTPDDVVFSFGVWKNGVNFGSSFAHITDAVATDAHQVTFTMDAPDNTLPSLLSGSVAGVMPKDFAGMTEEAFYAKPIGAGPYQVKEWASGGRIVLVRNPHYYASDRPTFDEVDIDVVTDPNQLTIQFQSGQADIVEYVSPSTAAQYPKGSVVVTPPSQVSHLSLNVTRAPFDDPVVRHAVAAVIDYQAIASGPFKGYATAPTGVLAPNLANWAPPSKPYFTTDVAAGQQLLAGTNAKAGFATELIYDSGNATDTLIAQIVQANLAKLGITVTLTGMETLAFLDRAFTLNADIVLWSYGAISPDISDPLGWIAGTGSLFTGDDDTTFAEHRNAYLATDDRSVQHGAVVAIQDEFVDRAAVIALAQAPTLHAVAADLTGFAPAPWGLYYFDTIRPK